MYLVKTDPGAHQDGETHMKRLLTAVLATSLASAAAGAIAAAPSYAAGGGSGGSASGQRGVGIRLADASVSRRNDPRAQIYVDDFVRPGTTFVRHVQISDFTDKPVHLLMYAAPATIAGENFSIAMRGQGSELTDWMTVTPSAVDLK